VHSIVVVFQMLFLGFVLSFYNSLWYAGTTELCTRARLIRCATKPIAAARSSSWGKKQSVGSRCRSPQTTTAQLRSLKAFLVCLVTVLTTVGYVGDVKKQHSKTKSNTTVE